ncbi:MAG: Hsp70 family protein, partial [Pseudomonadota bacterium]
EENAEDDKKRRALVEAKNQGESMLHSTEKSLSDHGDKVDEETRTAIELAMGDLKEALEGEDAEAITAKSQTLAESAMKLGEAIYKSEAESASAEAPDMDAEPANDTKAEDDVVDAEFEEVKDDDKKAS